DPAQTIARQLASARNADISQLRERHIADHRELFERVELTLPASDGDSLPTDERLSRLRTGTRDPSLAALYFQFGRYLLIACSRPGTLPANLQGIWNTDLVPPWGSKFTININTQMNYWPADLCNLSECQEP